MGVYTEFTVVVLCLSCFRPALTATSGFSTACFPPWWHDLFGFSHCGGTSERPLWSRSSAVLRPDSRHDLPHSTVSVRRCSTSHTTACLEVEFLQLISFPAPESPSTKSTTTAQPGPSPTPTDAVQSRMSTSMSHPLLNLYVAQALKTELH